MTNESSLQLNGTQAPVLAELASVLAALPTPELRDSFLAHLGRLPAVAKLRLVQDAGGAAGRLVYDFELDGLEDLLNQAKRDPRARPDLFPNWPY